MSVATPELINIVFDILYCIETNTLPDPGNGFDQTYLFRTAYMIVKNEREKIKNEREKAAIDATKKKGSKTIRPKGHGLSHR